MRVVVIGGGAAGFFAALSVRDHHPGAEIILLERSDKLLAKVRISGGGRCNVTHHCLEPRKLAAHYPRGERFLRRSFELFSVKDTVAWFAAHGVSLKVEADGRMFPVTDDSATIADLLLERAKEARILIELHTHVKALVPLPEGGFRIDRVGGTALAADRVIVATGGHPKPSGYDWLEPTGHTLVTPVPSLFTFNMPGDPVRELMGVVAPAVRARVVGSELETVGPLLITHWGMSGPAILRLSAWGARQISELDYRFTLQLNWLGGASEEHTRAVLELARTEQGRKLVQNLTVFPLPKRLWWFLLNKAGIPLDRVLVEVNKKERNRLVDLLTNDRYAVSGRTTFKEEFVTAGGIDLGEVDPLTMQSLKVPGLFLAGEVLDIDGITGGFNFQAAWTTGYLAGKSAASIKE
jgi:predicted Rossmann fold flavoprotein